MTTTDQAPIGVIGGSGLYELFDADECRTVQVDTPHGPPSGELQVGRLGQRPVVFLARHGQGHRLAPHEVNYRANVWALASLGVRLVVANTAVGSLDPEVAPGTFALPDQLLDLTRGRADTFYEGGRVEHLPFSDPFSPELIEIAGRELDRLGEAYTAGVTTAVIAGPRFATRAESQWYRAAGARIINMTQQPETALLRELNLDVVNLSFITDLDAGSEPGGTDAVDAEVVLRRMAEGAPRIRAAVAAVVAAIPADLQPRALMAPEAVDWVMSAAVRPANPWRRQPTLPPEQQGGAAGLESVSV